MKIEFSCHCGDTISELTRGDTSTNVQVKCGGCDSIYAVTISQIMEGNTAG